MFDPELALPAALEGMDGVLSRLLPVERLIPDIYAEWRLVVRDGVAFIGSHLSPGRLIPKLAEQAALPVETPLEKRLVRLIRRMPSFQKLGQIVARNGNLEAAFRQELIGLENSIQDVEPGEIQAEIHSQLGPRLARYAVEVEPAPLAEGSVSSVVRFTWSEPVFGRRQRGVFKVLKPYVAGHLVEELDLFDGMAGFFDANRARYGLWRVQWRELFSEIRQQLQMEVDLPREQQNLADAHQRLGGVPGVRVPKVIRTLCTESITAMTYEEGVKAADAFPHSPAMRKRLAERMVEALLAVPLFGAEAETVFHADPHAGNLFADERTAELLIFDWALTARVSRAERRALILLVLALALRDSWLACRIIAGLDQTRDQAQIEGVTARVREEVERCLRQIPPGAAPEARHVLQLLDSSALAGIRFPGSFLLFRKAIFTLQGVLHDLVPGMRLMPALVRCLIAGALGVGGFRAYLPIGPGPHELRSLKSVFARYS